MNQPDPAVIEPPVQEARRLRFELIFNSAWLAVGLFALPAVIYFVGASLLGPYGDNAGLGRFYADFFGDLAEPALRAWCIALGPLVLVSVIRAMFIGLAPRESAAAHKAHPKPPSEHARLEPRIGPE